MEKSGRYNTKQRDKLRSYLKDNSHRHITVEEIYESFRQSNNPIGTSTIYRYLDLLVREGVVRKFMVEKGSPACYQYFGESPQCNEHFHLRCNDCGQLFHVECDSLGRAAQEIEKEYGFKIDPSKTVFYGKCAYCGHSKEKK